MLKKPPPSPPNSLIASWLATGPRDHLLHPFQGVRVDRSAQRLRHSLRYEEYGHDDAYGQQHIKRAPGEIHPEIADCVGGAAGEASDESHCDGHAHCRRQKALNRDSDHLSQIGERDLAGIGLPARIGDEACCGVKGEIRRKSGEALRIQRQQFLSSEENVDGEYANGVEEQKGDCILGPFLLRRSIDPRKSIEHPFNGSEDRLQYRAFPAVNTR